MVLVQEDVVVHSQTGDDSPGYCEGCPRCQKPEGSWCSSYHQETPGVHPICKWCGHCVLRGKHIDDATDVRDGRYSGRNDYLN